MKTLMSCTFILVLIMFSSCHKDANLDPAPTPISPITNLVLPDASVPLEPNATQTLQGQGFTDSSEIWLRGGASEMKAQVTSVTSNSITFITPLVYNSQELILKEAGQEYILGTVMFEPKPPVLPLTETIVVDNNKYENYTRAFIYKGNKLVSINKVYTPSNYYDNTITFTYQDSLIIGAVKTSNDNSTVLATAKYDYYPDGKLATASYYNDNQKYKFKYIYNNDSIVARFYPDSTFNTESTYIDSIVYYTSNENVSRMNDFMKQQIVSYSYDDTNNPYANIQGYNKLMLLDAVLGDQGKDWLISDSDYDRYYMGRNNITSSQLVVSSDSIQVTQYSYVFNDMNYPTSRIINHDYGNVTYSFTYNQ